MVAGKARDGLVGDGLERGLIEREIRRQPGVFGEREHMSERRAFGNAAGDEIGSLQRKFRRSSSAPARSASSRQDAEGVVPPARAHASISRSR